MKSRLGIKFGMIVGVLILLQIPILMIQGQVNGRNATRLSVVQEISRSWGDQQTIVGPLLVVPYQTEEKDRVWDANLNQYRVESRQVNRQTVLAPTASFVDGDIDVTPRQRSIYTAPVYNSHLRLHGVFDLSVLDAIDGALGTPELVVLMSDLSGVLTIPSLSVNNTPVAFEEGGLHKTKGIKVAIEDWTDFSQYDVKLDLKGSQRLSLYPMAKNNEVNLSSNWQHPSFNGSFLPEHYRVGDEGFTAKWRTTSLSSNVNQLLDQCARGDCDGLMDASYGVTFFEPVNHYTMSDRASKYAILLIITTFAIFFVLETMKSTAIHPVQYLLVGLSLTIFNLLLVALTEHISFLASYVIGSIACIALLGAYAQYILKRASWLVAFVAALSSLYVLMYFILLSEDYAFLMGSGFLFLILASLMLATRKVNWYQLNPVLNKQPD